MNGEEIAITATRTIIQKYDDINREGIRDTPRRFIKALDELLTPIEFNPTVFDSQGYDEMIIDDNIQYYTLCEHHILPFFGTVKIGYIPCKKIIGLSKLPRLVEYYSKRLNTQEYFTQNIANKLFELVSPLGLGVIVQGRHLCAEMRGIKKQNLMTTSCLKGCFLSEKHVKEEFFKL